MYFSAHREKGIFQPFTCLNLQIGKRNESLGFRVVQSYEFFHPYHVPPTREFVAAIMEMCRKNKAPVLVKTYAAIVMNRIFYIGIGYAGI